MLWVSTENNLSRSDAAIITVGLFSGVARTFPGRQILVTCMIPELEYELCGHFKGCFVAKK